MEGARRGPHGGTPPPLCLRRDRALVEIGTPEGEGEKERERERERKKKRERERHLERIDIDEFAPNLVIVVKRKAYVIQGECINKGIKGAVISLYLIAPCLICTHPSTHIQSSRKHYHLRQLPGVRAPLTAHYVCVSGDHLQKMEREVPSSPVNMKGQYWSESGSGRGTVSGPSPNSVEGSITAAGRVHRGRGADRQPDTRPQRGEKWRWRP